MRGSDQLIAFAFFIFSYFDCIRSVARWSRTMSASQGSKKRTTQSGTGTATGDIAAASVSTDLRIANTAPIAGDLFHIEPTSSRRRLYAHAQQ